jgi:hypothetical protein
MPKNRIRNPYSSASYVIAGLLLMTLFVLWFVSAHFPDLSDRDSRIVAYTCAVLLTLGTISLVACSILDTAWKARADALVQLPGSGTNRADHFASERRVKHPLAIFGRVVLPILLVAMLATFLFGHDRVAATVAGGVLLAMQAWAFYLFFRRKVLTKSVAAAVIFCAAVVVWVMYKNAMPWVGAAGH